MNCANKARAVNSNGGGWVYAGEGERGASKLVTKDTREGRKARKRWKGRWMGAVRRRRA